MMKISLVVLAVSKIANRWLTIRTRYKKLNKKHRLLSAEFMCWQQLKENPLMEDFYEILS